MSSCSKIAKKYDWGRKEACRKMLLSPSTSKESISYLLQEGPEQCCNNDQYIRAYFQGLWLVVTRRLMDHSCCFASGFTLCASKLPGN